MKFCLFDIDGTLIVSGGAGQAALESASIELFDLQQIAQKIPYTGRTDLAIIHNLFSAHEIEFSQENIERLQQEYLRRLPVYLEKLEGRVLPGVISLLQQLSQRDDVVVGLITGNQLIGARLKLEYYNLFHFFQMGAYGDVHLQRDDVARDALSQLSDSYDQPFSATDIIVIGDTPADIQCARAIGARAIAVETGWHSKEELLNANADLLLTDLTEPDALLLMLNE